MTAAALRFGLAAALLLGAVAPLADAGTTSCIAGRPAAYCAIASSTISIDCTTTATAYACDVRADWSAGGSTRGPGAGESVGPVWLNWGLCDGFGCEEFFGDVGSPCSWVAGGHGCVRTGSLAETRSGALAGCLLVYVSQDVDAQVRLPGIPVTVASARERPIEEFSSC